MFGGKLAKRRSSKRARMDKSINLRSCKPMLRPFFESLRVCVCVCVGGGGGGGGGGGLPYLITL